MNIAMDINDRVNISPDLTNLPDWVLGTVFEIEDNPFVGKVISARTDDGRIFFGYADLFKPCTVGNLCTH